MQVKPAGYHDFSNLSSPRLIKSPYLNDKQHWSENAWHALPNALYWVHRREGKQPHPRPLKPLSNRLPCVRSNVSWTRLSLPAKIGNSITLLSSISRAWISLVFICTTIWSLRLVRLIFNFSMAVGKLLPRSLAWMLFFVSMELATKVYSRRKENGSLVLTTMARFPSSQVCVSPELSDLVMSLNPPHFTQHTNTQNPNYV